MLLYLIAIAAGAALLVIAVHGMARTKHGCSQVTNGRSAARTPFFWFIMFGVVIGTVLSGVGRHRSPLPAPPLPEMTGKMDGFESIVDAKVNAKEPVAKAKARIPADSKNPSWPVSTEYRESQNRAYDEAAAESLVDLIDYLQSQQPPVEWTPSESLIRGLITKTTKIEDKKFTTADGQEHWKYRCVGTFELTPALRTDILRHDREFRSQQRMLLMARVLAGLVAVLGSAAVYVRLDEMTKGYYTGWLRMAAVGFLGGTAGVLWLLTPMR